MRAPRSAGRVRPGGSLNVAGVCVTVEHVADDVVTATVSAETRRRTTFDCCEPGQRVNVERALAVGDPLDGHLVQGHVDAVGKVAGIDSQGAARRLWIRPSARVMPRMAAKGPIAVDGASLAVAEVARDRFSVVLIPATLEQTTLGSLTVGDRVNLESDLVARLAAARPGTAGADVARAVSSLGWAGHVSGRSGTQKVVTQLAAGGGVMVWDPDREVEGDVIFAGAAIRPEAFTFLLTRCCGHPTVPCAPEVLERLQIPPMPGRVTGTAPARTFPLTWPQQPGPGCRRLTGQLRSAGSRNQVPARPISCAPATCSRSQPGPACSPSGRATPNPRWRSARPRAWRRSECAAR